ncbi:bis(5'-nucleosyl)-tetraphosphatase (symmetrical) YqeK [Leptotrichia sp. OH3620_COT-345]|uniref:bis(5'-nucleosyl)-tetraphosphatase (symmetrical) YqeK n=1 Tax=Leptotrichia sp. OH3620_COT-345 TaxID=2491048 RepID=UPI0018F5D66C|nr:bis(5'-nucleosyl)-tetraphosphatase (symmetrical) YqeK [Leptotrichia sp. OH3620_COT-345]
MGININKIKENVKKYLDEKRYKHVERVAEAAKNLAGIYRISINETEAAAYLHDVAKFFELSVMIDLVKGKYPEIEDELSKSTAILHGFAGAEFIKNNYELFEIDNEEILNAVKYHTIGSGKMGVLSKIIYLADAIEDGRTWQGVEKARELAKYNLDEAIIFEINTKIEYLLSKRSIIHPNIILFWNSLICKKNKS